ncbi:hypothetical protein CsatA_013533 [Cannabis sativa]
MTCGKENLCRLMMLVVKGEKNNIKGVINDEEDDRNGSGEGDSGNDVEVSKDVVNDEKKEKVDDDFFKGYSQLPVEDDDVVTAGLKVVAKFQQLYALVPYDPQSTTSSNLTPYAQQLSSSSKVAVVTSKVKGLCALQQLIVDDVNDDDEKAFDAWF